MASFLPYDDPALAATNPVAAAIEAMGKARESHAQWAAWLLHPCDDPACPDHAKAAAMGLDVAEERAWTDAYDLVLGLLRGLLPPAEAAPPGGG